MFCPNCGAQNPDGSAFCRNCGQILTPQSQNPATPPQGQYNQPTQSSQPQDQYNQPQARYHQPQGQYSQPQGQYHQPQGQYHQPQGQYHQPQGRYYQPQGQNYRPQGQPFQPQRHGRNGAVEAIRKTASSPLFLTAVILYTLLIVMHVVSAITGANSLMAFVIRIINQYQFEIEQAAGVDVTELYPYLHSIMGTSVLSAILGQLLPILIAVGLWITWASARKPEMKSSGLTIIKVVYLIQMIFSCIGTVLGILGMGIMGFAFKAIANEAYSYEAELYSKIGTVSLILMAVFLICFVIMIFVWLKLIGSIGAGIRAVRGEKTDKFSMLIVVLLFLAAIGNLISGIMSAIISFSMINLLVALMTCVETILFALVLSSARGQMKQASAYESEIPPRPIQQPMQSYMPQPPMQQSAPQPFMQQPFMQAQLIPPQPAPQPQPVPQQPAPQPQPVPQQPAPPQFIQQPVAPEMDESEADSDETMMESLETYPDLPEEDGAAEILAEESEREEAAEQESETLPSASLHRVKTDELYEINHVPYLIGKGSQVDLSVLDNPTVSRRHAQIVWDDGCYWVIDLNSKNYTYVNDHKISSDEMVQLSYGTSIKFSDEEFIFLLG